jgi:hypothetical protein
MKNPDNVLQENLEALENGIPLPEVVSRLDVDSAELASLLQLVGELRASAHPQLTQTQTLEAKNKMMKANITKTLPTHRAWSSAPVVVGVAALMLALVFGLLSVFSTAGKNTARLANVSGLVEVASSDTADDWRIVESGDTIQAEQRLRTYDDSSVTLAFPEGSYSVIGANADLTLTALKSGSGGTIHVDMTQHTGKTSHRVVPFGGKDSAFVVHTPSGEARVHGTAFDVAVGENGLALFSVRAGSVEVNHAGEQIFLSPGQASVANDEIGLEDPAYVFALRGVVQAADATSLTVDGVKVSVHALTQVTGTPVVGSLVEVSGRILAPDAWLADSISVVTGTDPAVEELSFTGAIGAMDGSEWQIGGNKVLVNSATTRNPDLKVGDVVKVTFRVLDDGAWLAMSIDRLRDEEEPMPTETVLAPTSVLPPSSLVFQPASAEVYGCNQGSFSAQGTLQNTGAAASNVRLEVLVTDGAGFVNSATVSPERIDSIGAGQTAGFTVNVEMNSNWAAAVNQTVMVRVLLSHATNGPVQENAQFDFTIHSDCEATPTPTGTPLVTGTPGLSPTPEAPASACTGANPHPTGMRLAAEFGVPYEEIMGWFCQKFGFGEISQAYELSRESGVPVADIFTMRRSGMGWGNIKKIISNPGMQITATPKPGTGNDQDNPGKGPEKTKKPNPGKKK